MPECCPDIQPHAPFRDTPTRHQHEVGPLDPHFVTGDVRPILAAERSAAPGAHRRYKLPERAQEMGRLVHVVPVRQDEFREGLKRLDEAEQETVCIAACPGNHIPQLVQDVLEFKSTPEGVDPQQHPTTRLRTHIGKMLCPCPGLAGALHVR